MMTSAIMVEAYRKLVLINLIHKGVVCLCSLLFCSFVSHFQNSPLPRVANQSVVRTIKQICAPYEELATAFSTASLEDLNKAIDNNCEPFLKVHSPLLVRVVDDSDVSILIE